MRNFIFLVTCSIMLFGCSANPPAQLALAPIPPMVQQQTGSLPPLALETIDTRSANFIIQFDNRDDAATLISPAEPVRKQLAQLFQTGYTEAGYPVTPAAEKLVQFQLSKLVAQVFESSLKYEAKNEIEINVIARSDTQVLTKTYRAKGRLTGPFGADIAAIELSLNQLIGQLSADIINDPELNQFLKL